MFDLVPLDPPAGGELVPTSQPDLTLARRYAEAEKAAGTRAGYGSVITRVKSAVTFGAVAMPKTGKTFFGPLAARPM